MTVEDFVSYLPRGKYLCLKTGLFWTAANLNKRLPPVGEVPASQWLDENRYADALAWDACLPLFVPDRVNVRGIWRDAPGVVTLNVLDIPPVVPEIARLVPPEGAPGSYKRPLGPTQEAFAADAQLQSAYYTRYMRGLSEEEIADLDRRWLERRTR
jgi:hypothetical protein